MSHSLYKESRGNCVRAGGGRFQLAGCLPPSQDPSSQRFCDDVTGIREGMRSIVGRDSARFTIIRGLLCRFLSLIYFYAAAAVTPGLGTGGPFERLAHVDSGTITMHEANAEVEHCLFVPSLCRAFVPLKRFDLVNSDTFAFQVVFTEDVLRKSEPILCHAPVPLQRLAMVNSNAGAFRVAEGEVVLRVHVLCLGQ